MAYVLLTKISMCGGDFTMSELWEEFGRFVKELRSREGMTQADLSAKLDKSSSEVCRWEKGERRPKQTSLLALANIFGERIQVLQQLAGHTPEFDWLSSFLGKKELQEDILLTASEPEKEELREHLRYMRFRATVLKTEQSEKRQKG